MPYLLCCRFKVSINLSINLSIYLLCISIYPSISLSINQSIYIFISFPLSLSLALYLSCSKTINLSLLLSINHSGSISLPLSLSLSLSISPSIFIFFSYSVCFMSFSFMWPSGCCSFICGCSFIWCCFAGFKSSSSSSDEWRWAGLNGWPRGPCMPQCPCCCLLSHCVHQEGKH